MSYYNFPTSTSNCKDGPQNKECSSCVFKVLVRDLSNSDPHTLMEIHTMLRKKHGFLRMS